jgi:hypothetical protein
MRTTILVRFDLATYQTRHTSNMMLLAIDGVLFISVDTRPTDSSGFAGNADEFVQGALNVFYEVCEIAPQDEFGLQTNT